MQSDASNASSPAPSRLPGQRTRSALPLNDSRDGTGQSAQRLIRLTRPEHLVTAVPYLLGFHPCDSLVAVILRQGLTQVTARTDMPGASGADQWWEELASVMTESHADQVALIAYAPHQAEPVLATIVRDAPVPLLEVLRVEAGRWWCLYGPGLDCSPAEGNRLAEQPDVLLPFITALGSAPAASRARLGDCLTPAAPATIDDVENALTAFASATSQPGAKTPWTPRIGYRDLAAAHQARAGGPLSITPPQAARLLHALSHARVRDACLGWADDAAWWLWTDLMPLAPPPYVAPVASMIAAMAYMRGNSVLASLAAEHALAIDPRYQLAQLILDVQTAVILPGHFAAMVQAAASESAARLRGGAHRVRPGWRSLARQS